MSLSPICPRMSARRSPASLQVQDSTMEKIGAGNETRTRDPDLGKVVLYQLSYSRFEGAILQAG